MANETYLSRLMKRLDGIARPGNRDKASVPVIKLMPAVEDEPEPVADPRYFRPYPLPGEAWRAFLARMEGEGCTVEGDHEAFVVRVPAGAPEPRPLPPSRPLHPAQDRKAHDMTISQIARRGVPDAVRKVEGGVSSLSALLHPHLDPAQASGDGPRQAELAAAQKRLDAAERAIGDAAQRLKNSRGHLSDAEATEVVIREQPALYAAFRQAKWTRDAIMTKGPLIRV